MVGEACRSRKMALFRMRISIQRRIWTGFFGFGRHTMGDTLACHLLKGTLINTIYTSSKIVKSLILTWA